MLIKNYRLSQELKLENQKRKESEEELSLYLDVFSRFKMKYILKSGRGLSREKKI